MNDLNHERGILRRQIKDDVINHFRAQRSSRPPQQLLSRVLACHLIGRRKTCAPARVCAETYGNDAALLEALARPGWIGRSAMTPAMTGVAGWAAELATVGGLDFWQTLAPASIYAQLSLRPGAIRATIAGRSGIKVPTRAPSPTLSAPFVGEGQPIPVRQMALSTAALTPKKASVISEFSEEMMQYSMPSIENVIFAAVSYDTAVSIDGVLLDANPATAIRPAGILNGVVATPATAGGGLAGVRRRRSRAGRGHRGLGPDARSGAGHELVELIVARRAVARR